MLSKQPADAIWRPTGRVLAVRNSQGELWEAWGGSRNPVPPIVKELSYHHLPGVSAGNLAVLHKPSGVMLAGNTVEGQVRPYWPLPGRASQICSVHLVNIRLTSLLFLELKLWKGRMSTE